MNEKVQHRVRDYMTKNVITLTAEARLLDAALLIRRTGKRHVPIVNPEGKAVGIISDRDVARLAPSVLSHLGPDEYNQIFENTPVTLAMTKDPITILPDAPAQQAGLGSQSDHILRHVGPNPVLHTLIHESWLSILPM